MKSRLASVAAVAVLACLQDAAVVKAQEPDLSRFPKEEADQMRSACNLDLVVNGPAKYYACLRQQAAALRQNPAPDLSRFPKEEADQMRSACNLDLVVNGPAKYYACLRQQAAALRQNPAPDLSRFPKEEADQMRSACNLDLVVNGPAKYYACLRQQAAALVMISAQPRVAAHPTPSRPQTTEGKEQSVGRKVVHQSVRQTPTPLAGVELGPLGVASIQPPPVTPRALPTALPVPVEQTKKHSPNYLGLLAVLLVWGLFARAAIQRCKVCKRLCLDLHSVGVCDRCYPSYFAELRAGAAKRRAEEARQREQAAQDARERERRNRSSQEAEAQRRKQEDDERRRKAGESLDDLQKLTGSQFEEHVMALFRRDGYRVSRSGGSGDEGIDLILHIDGANAKDVVQCKRWKSDIGPAVVREFYGSIIHVGARLGFVITTASFSEAASAWARGKPILLIDGRYLLAWAKGAKSSRSDGEASRSRAGATDPYSILGLSRGASKDEIRAAYRRLIAQYHPDKVASLAPEYQEIARAKSQQINDAYRQLSRS